MTIEKQPTEEEQQGRRAVDQARDKEQREANCDVDGDNGDGDADGDDDDEDTYHREATSYC